MVELPRIPIEAKLRPLDLKDRLLHHGVFERIILGGVFGGSRNLVDVTLSGLSLGEVTGLDAAFYGCESLEHVDL